MSSRRKKPGSSYSHRDLAVRELDRDLLTPPGRVITVYAPLPRPVAYKARREIYAYPLPFQKRLKGRVIRKPLALRNVPYVMTKVRIRLPARLPLARPSYVSLSRGRLNVHSRNQLRRLMEHGELNRRRYSEYKRNRRRAHHGQLDSPGADGFGAVAAAARIPGADIGKIADAALVARAVLKGRVR